MTNAFLRRRYVIGVRGRFYCYGQPDNNVRVQLYNQNWRRKHFLIETQKSGNYGRFEVKDPILKIIHYCNEINLRCYYEGFIPISKKAIKKGKSVKGFLNLGVIETLKIRNQKKVCPRGSSRFRKRRQRKGRGE